jgi:DUF4097 and DUF4098 domain-containing protein YvlB
MKQTLIASTALLLALMLGTAAQAEVTREIEADLSVPEAKVFAIENLIGSMRIVPGPGDTVQVSATVHAENEELADSVKLEKKQKGDKTVLRVAYPLDEHSTIRLPNGISVSAGGGFLERWFGGGVKYGGHSVKVREGRGVLLYADVRVQLPERDLRGQFRNLFGQLHAERVRGDLRFDTNSADITLSSLRGEIDADTGSGSVKANDIEGAFRCDTGSGNCDLEAMRGESVDCDTGSGDVTLRSVKVSGKIEADTGSGDVHGHDLEGSFVCDTGSGDCTVDGLVADSVRCDTGSGTVRMRSVTADSILADTGSGDVLAEGINAREFAADTGSGDVHLGARGDRLRRVRADTGSGHVKLLLQADASFELRADTGSGELISRFEDAKVILDGKEVIGYRRGDAKIQLTVDTGSGDVTVEPAGQ